jgi:hypothetical protein
MLQEKQIHFLVGYLMTVICGATRANDARVTFKSGCPTGTIKNVTLPTTDDIRTTLESVLALVAAVPKATLPAPVADSMYSEPAPRVWENEMFCFVPAAHDVVVAAGDSNLRVEALTDTDTLAGEEEHSGVGSEPSHCE